MTQRPRARSQGDGPARARAPAHLGEEAKKPAFFRKTAAPSPGFSPLRRSLLRGAEGHETNSTALPCRPQSTTEHAGHPEKVTALAR